MNPLRLKHPYIHRQLPSKGNITKLRDRFRNRSIFALSDAASNWGGRGFSQVRTLSATNNNPANATKPSILLILPVGECGQYTIADSQSGGALAGIGGWAEGNVGGVVVYNAGVGAGRVLCLAGGVALVSGCLLDDGGVSGVGLRRAFGLGLARLEERRDAVNALNVFPVPDGDTGTNMSLTLRAGIEGCPEGDAAVGAGAAARGLADGAFFGARGNSGVILSQFLRGFAMGLEGCEVCGAGDWARGLDAAREAAYGAVGTPREGTMLTVMRRAAEAALGADAEGGDGDLAGTAGGDDVVRARAAGYLAACAALRDTPEQLAALKEAGVVDSGGLGVVVILGGVLEALFPERFGALSDVPSPHW